MTKRPRLEQIRARPVNGDQFAAVRRLVESQAADPDERDSLLGMLGLADPAPSQPPIEVCACGAQMYRPQWPSAWKEGRVRHCAKGQCVRCYHTAYRAKNPRKSASKRKRTP